MFELVLSELFDTSKWNMERKYVVRRRWFFTAIVALVLFIMFQVIGNLWWTSDGYCWGDMFECFEKDIERSTNG